VGKENCRSLGCARDDKGGGSAHLSSRYRGMGRAAGYPRFSSLWVGRLRSYSRFFEGTGCPFNSFVSWKRRTDCWISGGRQREILEGSFS
jgi:hypothetical protein